MTRGSMLAFAAMASALSCKPVPATEPATEAPVATPASNDAAPTEPAEPADAEPDAAPDPTSVADAPPATTDAADPADTTPPTEPADPAAGPTEPVEPARAAVELPAPIHDKVDASCGKDPGVGDRLRAFKLPSIVAGKTISNKTYRGRVVLVNFWATWCKPCLKELPEFDQLYRHYKKAGLTVLAISTEAEAAPIEDYLSKHKVAAKIAYGGEDYAGTFGSPEFPFSFVVDEKGVIRGSYRGYKPECMDKLEADIRAQLEARVASSK